MSTRVLLHIKREGKNEWGKDEFSFSRVPTVGEYLSQNEGAQWYQVQLVVHRAMMAQDADVYVVEVEGEEVLKALESKSRKLAVAEPKVLEDPFL